MRTISAVLLYISGISMIIFGVYADGTIPEYADSHAAVTLLFVFGTINLVLAAALIIYEIYKHYKK